MNKKSKNIDVPVVNRNRYVTYMEYFATGEGVTHEVATCFAKNNEEAVNLHLKQFGNKTKADRDYFRPLVVALSLDDNGDDVKKLLERFFTDGKQMFRLMRENTFDLHFKVYWNFS